MDKKPENVAVKTLEGVAVGSVSAAIGATVVDTYKLSKAANKFTLPELGSIGKSFVDAPAVGMIGAMGAMAFLNARSINKKKSFASEEEEKNAKEGHNSSQIR